MYHEPRLRMCLAIQPKSRKRGMRHVDEQRYSISVGSCEQHDLISWWIHSAGYRRRTSSSSALSSPSVGPFEPRAAGSRFIIPSTSFTILIAASTDAAPVEEAAGTESDVGPSSPVAGLAAGVVTALSLSVFASASGGGRWSEVERTLCATLREAIPWVENLPYAFRETFCWRTFNGRILSQRHPCLLGCG